MIFRVFKILNKVRLIVVNVLFFTLLGFALLLFFSQKPRVEKESLLLINPVGTLKERNNIPFSLIENLWKEERPETSSVELMRVIREAGRDKRIRGILLDLSKLDYASLSVLQDLEGAFSDFREQGKEIYAWSDSYSLYSYYLAAVADDVTLDPLGNVNLPGYSLYRSYYREAMERWNADVAYFYAGDFKSYGDAYTQRTMPQEVQKENLRWLKDLWDQYQEGVLRHRSLSKSQLGEYINDFPRLLGDYPSGAIFAKDYQLVDDLRGYYSFIAQWEEEPLVYWQDYLSLLPQEQKAQVLVVSASGGIQEGTTDSATIGADSLGELLNDLLDDLSLKALVLHLDTEGGAVYASELIRRRLAALQQQGVIVVVSMGGLTASGGYWIASTADEVWASPGSITGSIGVFLLYPELAAFYNKTLGIRQDGVGTTWQGGQSLPGVSLNNQSRLSFQTGVDQIYEEFLNLIVQGRGMDYDTLRPLAEGRIWTGREALERGLVDRLGSLFEAIQGAATLAGLGEDYKVAFLSEKKYGLKDSISLPRVEGISLGGIKEALPSLRPGEVYSIAPLATFSESRPPGVWRPLQ